MGIMARFSISTKCGGTSSSHILLGVIENLIDFIRKNIGVPKGMKDGTILLTLKAKGSENPS
jgi:hypothetical protein